MSPLFSALFGKRDCSHQWSIKEEALDGSGTWGIIAIAARVNKEETIGLGWTLIEKPAMPVSSVCLHQEPATRWLRTLYSTFAALQDPADYMSQIGVASFMAPERKPSVAIVGSVREHGALQVIADWSRPQRFAEISVYPQSGPVVRVCLGLEGIAHVVQLTDKAFKSLSWHIPN